MRNVYPPKGPLATSVLDWLVLSGMTHALAEEAGTAWKRAESADAAPKELAVGKTEPSPAKPALPGDPVTMGTFPSLEAFQAFCASWKEIGLAKTASRAVRGLGPPEPRLMVIGDMPDDSEDRSGNAFSGAFNQLIKQALIKSGYELEQVHFTYLSKWRTPSKRNLTSPEFNICKNLLQQEIALVKPKAILALGESVYRALQGDSSLAKAQSPTIYDYINQDVNYKTPLLCLQKSEFLVKNPLMKKSFWFSLIEFAAANRPRDVSVKGAPDNNAESTATFP